MEEKIFTIGKLREAIAHFKDDDFVVVEIHEGLRSEDLYPFTIDLIDNVFKREDGSIGVEVRLCI